MDIHVQCAIIALLGMAIQVTLKVYSIKQKAKQANVSLSVGEYFKQDWLLLLAGLITIGIFLFMFDDIVGLHTSAIHYVKFLFAFVGWTGSDILLRLFSAANKKLNNIIDAKTTVADTVTQKLGTPTHIEEGAKKNP